MLQSFRGCRDAATLLEMKTVTLARGRAGVVRRKKTRPPRTTEHPRHSDWQGEL